MISDLLICPFVTLARSFVDDLLGATGTLSRATKVLLNSTYDLTVVDRSSALCAYSFLGNRLILLAGWYHCAVSYLSTTLHFVEVTPLLVALASGSEPSWRRLAAALSLISRR